MADPVDTSQPATEEFAELAEFDNAAIEQALEWKLQTEKEIALLKARIAELEAMKGTQSVMITMIKTLYEEYDTEETGVMGIDQLESMMKRLLKKMKSEVKEPKLKAYVEETLKTLGESEKTTLSFDEFLLLTSKKPWKETLPAEFITELWDCKEWLKCSMVELSAEACHHEEQMAQSATRCDELEQKLAETSETAVASEEQVIMGALRK